MSKRNRAREVSVLSRLDCKDIFNMLAASVCASTLMRIKQKNEAKRWAGNVCKKMEAIR
jgi:hypothetical protein